MREGEQDMTEKRNADQPAKDAAEGRRKADRRQAHQDFEGPDRRQGERRSGEDRRTTPRR
jgi:hypothetical protein